MLKYYAIAAAADGRGYAEYIITREPRNDGLRPADAGYRGMRMVSMLPTGTVYRSFRAADAAIAEKNRHV